ncbi:MAG TPA: phosphoketolase family protein [Thermomicrobiales bacterium]|nr:phosphoketolase family protein [Thermomicrobiales bacterium]
MKTEHRMYQFDTAISSAVPADAAVEPIKPDLATRPLDEQELARMHRYWQAANYLTIGQIYLQENPLLREPLTPEHIKPRLLGHWGTSPGLNLIYVHMNRLIRQHDLDAIYLAGPGHGGPAIVANVYLEGTYSEIYPDITQDEAGMRLLFRQFSTPGGIPSHVSVPTPGSIHEGGELGYVLSHAFGAAFDNPDMIAVAVVGDGEAETGPLAGAWQSTTFLNPARDGAVLPILHLNGYKIANPTVLGRSSDDDIHATISGHGYEVFFVEGDDPMRVHQELAATLDVCYQRIRGIQADARADGVTERPRWPAIVLRTPKGWTGPAVVDDKPVEGTFRSHQVPLSGVRQNPEHLRQLEVWLRSYGPEDLFDDDGTLMPELAELAPEGNRRMGANPHANGGPSGRDLTLPDFRDYAVEIKQPGTTYIENTRPLGTMLRDTFTRNAAKANFRLFSPDELASNRLQDVLQVENRCFIGPMVPAVDESLAPDGRVMEVLSEHLCQGWLEGYTLTGRHGMFVTYEAFAMVSASMLVQHTKWLQEAIELPWRRSIPSLNVLLTSTAWRNDHNGFSHQGPGLIDVLLSKRGTVARIYLPPDVNTLLSVADHCLRSEDYVNLIVVDKQPHLQYLPMDAAIAHCTTGAGIWEWAGNTKLHEEPDVVLACAGDVPTMEALAASDWLQANAPELKIRFVNVVDLMTLLHPGYHPHGLDTTKFTEFFTGDKQVIFAFHGYQRAIHDIIHGRPNAPRFHVRGFMEQGTTTTPFNMVSLNGMSRYHLAYEALRRAHPSPHMAQELMARLKTLIADAETYAVEHFEDPPEIRDWTWSGGKA